VSPADRTPEILALHSSSAVLGVACGSEVGDADDRVATFPLGRRLSNDLFTCVESLLPARCWPHLRRLAVATGPGGFTGTRLTVVFARTLAQQLQCPLDGRSSFLLMAHRFLEAGTVHATPFWIRQGLPRRGSVLGCYGRAGSQVVERVAPRLVAPEAPEPEGPILEARDDVAADVSRLLRLSRRAAAAAEPGPWSTVLPIYPTSPVGPL
jgi:tRNA threonylcarbamoyl adenosine modification protein YeaZ